MALCSRDRTGVLIVTLREQLGLSGFIVAVPLLVWWAKLRLWDWQARRDAES